MGYGKKAMQLLKEYFEFKIPNVENIDSDDKMVQTDEGKSKKKLPPLLLKLSERVPEHLDYLGVSYGLTEPLIKFWKRNDFVPLYIAQNTNDITGEHSCIMLSAVNHALDDETPMPNDWLPKLWTEFRGRFIFLLSGEFRKFNPSLALHVLYNDIFKTLSNNGNFFNF